VTSIEVAGNGPSALPVNAQSREPEVAGSQKESLGCSPSDGSRLTPNRRMGHRTNCYFMLVWRYASHMPLIFVGVRQPSSSCIASACIYVPFVAPCCC